MMARILPHPAMSVFVIGTWLMLNQSLAPGHLLTGCVLGILLGLVFEPIASSRPGSGCASISCWSD